MKVENWKTTCCKASWYVKSRADFRCSKCDKDVTLEVVLLAEASEEPKKITKIRKTKKSGK